MVTRIKQLMVSAMLVLESYFNRNRKSHVLTPSTLEGELEPEPVRQEDDWDKWMHHDDVTPEEQADLFSDDPEKILSAEARIFERQKEFHEFWNNNQLRRRTFQDAYLKDADLNRPQTPMDDREGWGDEDEKAMTFIGIDPLTGELGEVYFDSIPEWRNVITIPEETSTEVPEPKNKLLLYHKPDSTE